LNKAFSAGRETENAEDAELKEASGMELFYRSSSSGKNWAGIDFPIVI